MIGGSYIGCEVAASLTAIGKRCTIVMQEDFRCSGPSARRAGRFFERVLREHGVTNPRLPTSSSASRAQSASEKVRDKERSRAGGASSS